MSKKEKDASYNQTVKFLGENRFFRQSDARWWCAMKGAQKMKVGPSTGIEQANLSNHSNAAVVKPMVVSD